MITFLNNQEKQIQQLENQLRNTRRTFMDSADIFITRVKEKIVEESKPKRIKKIFELSVPSETSSGWHNEKENSHAYTITFEPLKPTLMHRVSMISQTKPIIHKTSFQHTKFKMPTLNFFDESKFEYEDDVEIKKMGTGMDEEPLEHTNYENDKSSNPCHKTLPTSNPPINQYSTGSFTLEVVDFKPCREEANIGVDHNLTHLHQPFMIDRKKHYGFKPGLLSQDGFPTRSLSKLIEDDPFLRENLNPPTNPIESGKVMMIGSHIFEHIIHPPIFPHVAYFHRDGVYRYFHPHLIPGVGKISPISVK